MRTTDTLKTRRRMKDIKFEISYGSFVTAAAVYLTLPVLIFFLGYLKIIPGILFSALTLISAYLFLKNKGTSDRKITFDLAYLLVIIPLILLMVFIGGIGEFGFSMSDHSIRYAILNDLVEYKWPVVYDFSTQQNPVVASVLGEGKAAFAYYFVYWMIPAVTGKLFGLTAARVMLLLWTAAGLFIVSIGACLVYGKASKALFVGLMLFAGFDVIPYAVNNLMGVWSTWERWNAELIVVGNFYQLMNVFNQCIPGWIITLLLILCVNGRGVGFLGSLMFCYSPWAAIGVLPMCVCKMIVNSDSRSFKGVMKTLLTPENLIPPVVFFIAFASLYTANSNATSEAGFTWTFYDSPLIFLRDYILFVMIEFGIWFLLIRKRHPQDPMFLTAMVTMLVLPFYKITYANDFLMRGSMAPMFLLSVYVAMFVTDHFYRSLNSRKFELLPRLVLLTLILAAYTTFNLMLYSSIMTVKIRVMGDTEDDISHNIVSFGNIRKEDELEVIRTQFYVYDYEDTIFFKYLSK